VGTLRVQVLPACGLERFVRVGAALLEQEVGKATLVVAELDGPHVVLGRWQRARSAVHLAACGATGLRVTRRLGGGRAALCTPGTVGVLLAVPPGAGLGREIVGADKVLNRHVRGLLRGLRGAGAARGAFYFGRDVVVADKQQVALVSQDGAAGGTALFEALVAAREPLALPAGLSAYPPHGDPRAGGPPCASLAGIGGGPRPFEAVAEAIVSGYAEVTGVALARDEQAPGEAEAPGPPVDEDEAGWAESGVADVPIGFVEALVRREGATLAAARLRGDFIAPGFVVSDLETSLAGCPFTFDAIAARIDAAFARRGAVLHGVNHLRLLADALLAAGDGL
jgi:hypothetical protein